MERFVHERFAYLPGLADLSPDDNEPGIVILHGQSAIVLRPFHIPYVLALQHAASRDVSGVRKRATAKVFGFADIDEDCGLIVSGDVPEPVRLYLRHAAQCAPDWDTELIATNVGVTRREELLGKPLALTAVGTVTVKYKRGLLLPLEQPTDFRNIGNVGRHGNAGLCGDVLGTRYVTDRVLSEGARVENYRAHVSENASELLRRNLDGSLPGFAERRLIDVPGSLSVRGGQ